jgi:hypothetical protein
MAPVLLSEEDQVLITKAMLLGCSFYQSKKGRWYSGLGTHHPLLKARYARDSLYGYENPVEMAREYIAYFTKEGS